MLYTGLSARGYLRITDQKAGDYEEKAMHYVL